MCAEFARQRTSDVKRGRTHVFENGKSWQVWYKSSTLPLSFWRPTSLHTALFTRWSMILSSEVNLRYAIFLRALCGVDWVTLPCEFGGNEKLVLHRVVERSSHLLTAWKAQPKIKKHSLNLWLQHSRVTWQKAQPDAGDAGIESSTFDVPLSSELGTYKAVRTRFWYWLSGQSP